MFKFLKRKKGKDSEDKLKNNTTTDSSTTDSSHEQPAESIETVPQPQTETEQTVEIQQPIAETIEERVEETLAEQTTLPPSEAKEPKAKEKKPSLFKRLTSSLSKTRSKLASGLSDLFLGKKVIDDELLEDIETQLISADVGIEATEALIDDLTAGISRKEIKDPQAVLARLKQGLLDIIKPCQQPLSLEGQAIPYVILMVGVNGSGKTTTIGKLAKKFQLQGKKVMLAAGDTFRAAAIEQLQVWGMRNDVPVIAQHSGADSASVAFDALSAAKARNIDVLIVDTAGRLHTHDNLMQELEKVKRVLGKQMDSAPHEVMLVVDASIGQNALVQAEKFHQSVGLHGITITKLDGTAKGGILFAIASKLKLPIRYIGCGEQIDDLREFDADEFIEALFTSEETETEAL